MKNTIKKLAANLHKENYPLLKGKSILVAVSGGIDSMVLLKYIQTVQSYYEIHKIGIVHLNHNLRKQSELEEEYISKYAQNHNLEFYTKKLKHNKPFSEELGRKARYELFERVMTRYDYDVLVTAHHYNDVAENVLMRIIRGSRLLDIKGMDKSKEFANGLLIRPFLSVPKSTLYEIIDNNDEIEYFEDVSNSGNDYFRNRVRNLHIPALKTENPKLENHLVSLSDEVQSLNTALNEFIKDINYTNLEVFKSYTEGTQKYFLQHYIKNYPEFKINKGRIKDLHKMILNDRYYEVVWDKKHKFIKNKENFKIELIEK